MQTKVVNLRTDKYTKYIGRGSPLGNPFRIGKDGTRKEVIQKFKQHFLNDPKLQLIAKTYKGEILGCFCKPLPCHGDIIVEFLNEKESS